MEYKLTAPLSKADAAKLRAGDTVLLSGTIYTARDAAHKRLCALAAEGKPLPFAIEDAVVYYAGPTPPAGRGDRFRGPHHQLPYGRLRAHAAGHGPDGHDWQRRAGAGGRGGHAPRTGAVYFALSRRGCGHCRLCAERGACLLGGPGQRGGAPRACGICR